MTASDALGWRPDQGQLDRFGREIPDREYTTEDFDRAIVLHMRTEAIAKHLSDFLKKSGSRFDKTIVFCADQEHAARMTAALNRHNADLVKQYPDWVCQVTSDQGDIGRGHLDNFTYVDRLTPVILTTSKLLTTGVDAPTCKNVVLARVVRSMTEFKQIIGRGTRVRDDYDKLFFNIIDYTGSATRLFADPDFDGYPADITEEEMDAEGNVTNSEVVAMEDPTAPPEPDYEPPDFSDPEWKPRKYYVDNVEAHIAAEAVYELDASGRHGIVRLTDYTAEKVRTLYPNSAEMRRQWADPQERARIIEALTEHNIDFERLAQVTNQPDADPFDLLCHVAFNAPIRTRRERANRVRLEETAFFEQYTGKAREILFALLEKYAEHGTAQFDMDVLKVPPISNYGNLMEIVRLFGGAEQLRSAVETLQTLLYAA